MPEQRPRAGAGDFRNNRTGIARMDEAFAVKSRGVWAFVGAPGENAGTPRERTADREGPVGFSVPRGGSGSDELHDVRNLAFQDAAQQADRFGGNWLVLLQAVQLTGGDVVMVNQRILGDMQFLKLLPEGGITDHGDAFR